MYHFYLIKPSEQPAVTQNCPSVYFTLTSVNTNEANDVILHSGGGAEADFPFLLLRGFDGKLCKLYSHCSDTDGSKNYTSAL